MLDQADQGLYASKRSGRNRVTAWTAAAPQPADADHAAAAAAAPPGPVPATTQPDHLAPEAAMAYPNLEPGLHARAVAELCSPAAPEVLSLTEGRSVGAVAALLPETDRVVVPASIFLSPVH
jgi:hypothetical protein